MQSYQYLDAAMLVMGIIVCLVIICLPMRNTPSSAARFPPPPQPSLFMGWVIADGKSSPRFRTWKNGWPEWTADVEEALVLARRQDAEQLAAEDDDAWRILRVQSIAGRLTVIE